jgi:hypothetical protein
VIRCSVFRRFSQGIGRASQVINFKTPKAVDSGGWFNQSGDSFSMG